MMAFISLLRCFKSGKSIWLWDIGICEVASLTTKIYSMLSQVSTEIGDHSQVHHVGIHYSTIIKYSNGCCTNAYALILMISDSTKPPRPTQTAHPSASRKREYWWWLRPRRGKNGEFRITDALLSGMLSYLPGWWKALAVNRAGHPADLGCMLA